MEVEPQACEEKLLDQGAEEEDTEVIKLSLRIWTKTYEVCSLLLIVVIILRRGTCTQIWWWQEAVTAGVLGSGACAMKRW